MRTWISENKAQPYIQYGKRIVMQFNKTYYSYLYDPLVVVLPDTKQVRTFVKCTISNISFSKLDYDYTTKDYGSLIVAKRQSAQYYNELLNHYYGIKGFWYCTGKTFGDIILDIEHYLHKDLTDRAYWMGDDINYVTCN